MLRALTVAVLLMAAGGCGMDDADPHALVACEPGWVVNTRPISECEAACQTPTPAHMPGTEQVACNGTPTQKCFTTDIVTFEGLRGCCYPTMADANSEFAISFFGCE